MGCCKLAASDGYDWTWVDTCCIDKSSSAELSEAINSMYRWYAKAHVCYAYLADVDASTLHDSYRGGLKYSRWFGRGWTLQELIAPAIVEFYDVNWQEMGAKSSMTETLHEITGIDVQVLEGRHPSSCNVAERMSWASTRETTRPEDAAYSLLGLFGIGMPLLYGEGCNAFKRLQEEILKSSQDYTLLAWKDLRPSGTFDGVLSPSAKSFSQRVYWSNGSPFCWFYNDLRRQSWPQEQDLAQKWSNTSSMDLPVLMSGRLQLRLPVTDLIVDLSYTGPDTWGTRTAFAYLGYVEVKSGSLVCIKLRSVPWSDESLEMYRCSLELLPASWRSRFTLTTVTLVTWRDTSMAPQHAAASSLDWHQFHDFRLSPLPSCITAASKHLSRARRNTANVHEFHVSSEHDPTYADMVSRASLQEDTGLSIDKKLWGLANFYHKHDSRTEIVGVRFGSTRDALACQIIIMNDSEEDRSEWHRFAHAPVQGLSYQSHASDGSGNRQVCARIKRLPSTYAAPSNWTIRITCEARS